MKVYKCDCCGAIVDDPHRSKMTHFLTVASYELEGAYPKPIKEKVKVDLCDQCLGGLRDISSYKNHNAYARTFNFLTAWKRMCDKSNHDCQKCPAKTFLFIHGDGYCELSFQRHPKEAIEFMQKWANENPYLKGHENEG